MSGIKAGYRPQHPELAELEYRLQAARLQIRMLCRRLSRLRAAILDFLNAGNDDRTAAEALLRCELSKAGEFMEG